ncbi:MAG: magnesium/cobalt transporter CorA [Planctomycetes bacterium]|nr:magnesium/cobalt transporter CorA [Planctomycetota bacterium]
MARRPAPRKRRRRRRRSRAPVGSAPGILTVDPDALASKVHVIGFGPMELLEESACDLRRLSELRQRHAVVWIQVRGLGDVELLRRLGEMFELHRLALADVANVQQRAKVEDYGPHEFVVARQVSPAPDQDTEQFAMFVGKGFVLSFQERAEDCFEMVRRRLFDAQGMMRQRGSDYLAYALLDSVVDSYFPLLEQVSDRLQSIEDELLDVVESQSKRVLGELHECRRVLASLRRALWPLREATGALLRGESQHFSADVRPYLRDVHDHVVQQLDLLENHRELVSSLLELHLSLVNQRLNEVMKVLTIIATIFIPLTFIVGLYGMNFDWMPETKVWWGYPVCLTVMAVMAAFMVRWFRRRGWL